MCLEGILKCMFEVLLREPVTHDDAQGVGEAVRVLHAVLIW